MFLLTAAAEWRSKAKLRRFLTVESQRESYMAHEVVLYAIDTAHKESILGGLFQLEGWRKRVLCSRKEDAYA